MDFYTCEGIETFHFVPYFFGSAITMLYGLPDLAAKITTRHCKTNGAVQAPFNSEVCVGTPAPPSATGRDMFNFDLLVIGKCAHAGTNLSAPARVRPKWQIERNLRSYRWLVILQYLLKAWVGLEVTLIFRIFAAANRNMITQVIDEKLIKRAKELIDNAASIAVVCHTSPDGDAIGSSLAAVSVLSLLGKEVRAVVPDSYLENLRQLPGAKEIVDGAKYYDFACALLRDSDLVLCLDFNDTKRVGRLQHALEQSKAKKIVIDHHLGPDIDADVVISYPEMSSTSYLLFRFFCRLELFDFIGKDSATCLLAGMMTDTGNFAYNCNDPEEYVVVAELVRKGADKEKLYNQLFNTFSANCMRLNSYAILRKMELFPAVGAALISLSRDELNRFQYTRGDTEGLVNRPLAIPGMRFSVFLRQESDCIRVSMRSRGTFPVNIICQDYFNGGGHLNAGGGEYKGTLDQAIEFFKSILPEIDKRFKNL